MPDLYMKVETQDQIAVAVGIPVAKPTRAALLDGDAVVGCGWWSDADLLELVGYAAVDPAAGFDPAIHEATGGGTVSAGLATPAFQPRPVTREMVAAEAERRIAAGINVDGKAFRADDASVSRVDRMKYAFDAAIDPPGGISFMTAAGDTFTLTSAVQATALFDALITHQAAVLATSSVLQASLPVDYETNAAWPDPAAIAL